MQLRIKAILFISILIIFLAGVMGIFLEFSLRENFKTQMINNVSTITEALEGQYYGLIKGLQIRGTEWSGDKKIRKIADILASTTSSQADKDRAIKDFEIYVKSEKMPFDKDVLIADLIGANGVVVASTDETRRGKDEGNEETASHSHFFSKAIKSTTIGESFVRGVVFEEDETPEPMTHVISRIFSLKKDEKGSSVPLPFVLLVHFIPTQQIGNMLTGSLQEKEGGKSLYSLVKTFRSANIFLVNKDRRIVFSARQNSKSQHYQKIDTPIVESCLRGGNETNGEYIDWNGTQVIGSTMCLVRDELVLITEIDSSEAFAFYTTFIVHTAYGMLLILILVTVGTYFALRYPLRRVENMSNVARKVSQGDFSFRITDNDRDEIGYLAHTINVMLDTIAASQEKIKKIDTELREKSIILTRDVEEHHRQEKFLEDSKRATLNLLDDAWKTKEKLEQESMRLQTIISSIGEGLILIDGQYHVALVNPMAVRMFDIPAAKMLGKDLRDIVKLWKNKKYEVPFEQWPTEEMFLTKKTVRGILEDNFSITTHDHSEHIPIAFSIAPLALGEGSAGAVITFHDVSEDRALDEAKSGFISVASHQLRTPLTSIRWYSEMLLSEDAGELNPAQRDFLSEIHGGAERLYQTVDLLLGLSRVESGKMKTEKTTIDIGQFTDEVVRELSSYATEKKVSLQVYPPSGEAIKVFLDPLALRQVVLNLISNAIRYSHESGIVEMRWWIGEHGETVYAVRDSGIGIPEAQRGRLFTKFFRAENAVSKAPDGSGLGLALVKELVEAPVWGGKVWFESREGQGSTFYFTVPAVGTPPSVSGTDHQ